MTKRQGLNRDLPPGKEQWLWVPTSATLIYGQRDAVLGRDLVVVEVGHTDTDHTTCLHVPSVGLVVAGDVAYAEDKFRAYLFTASSPRRGDGY